MKKKYIIIFMTVIITSCQTTQNNYHYDDPFSTQLDTYYSEMQTSKKGFGLSVMGFAASFVAGSIAINMRSAEIGSRTWNNAGIITSYAVSTLFFGTGTYFYINWSDNVDLYWETLRLQTQYYNSLKAP